MDSRADVIGPKPGHRAAAPAVRCEQAIFTSIPGPTGSGYRLVATSGGLSRDERQQIATRSPSHDALCDPGPDATALSFYPLDSGRLCLAHSCYAGLEGSGRGGWRTYTRAVVIDAPGLASFGYNPFAVARALVDSGQAEPDLTPPPELPALLLPVGVDLPVDALSQCVAQVNGDWLTCFITDLLDRRSMLIVGAFDPIALVEGLLLALPGPLRAELSFGAGLRFSLGRSFVLNVGDGDLRHLARSVQGHDLTLFAPGTRPAPKLRDVGPWLQMARRHCEGGCWNRLRELTSRDYTDCSLDTLNGYGHLANLIDGLSQLGSVALIELLDDYLAAVSDDDLEAELTITLVRGGLQRLTDLWSTAAIEELIEHGPTLIQLWRRSARTTTLLNPLVAAVLKRLTRQALLAAVNLATQVIGWALQPGTDAQPVRQAVDDLLDHLGEWIHDAPADQIEALPELLGAWPAAPQLSDRITQLAELIDARLEPSQETA